MIPGARAARSKPVTRLRGRARVTRSLGVAALVLAAGSLAFAPSVAHADGRIIDLHGGLVAGGMTGWGNGGAGSPDFFHQVQDPGLGLELGLRVLVLELSIRFVQMFGAEGRGGTLSTVMFGPTLEIPLLGGGTDADGHRRLPKLVLRPGLAAGVGLGTPAPVNPPLSADQISGKGFLGMARCGVEWFFGPVFGLEAHVEGGYHYFIGGEGLVNGADMKGHSSGGQIALFGSAVVHLGL
jgi:hypothetical protein